MIAGATGLTVRRYLIVTEETFKWIVVSYNAKEDCWGQSSFCIRGFYKGNTLWRT